MNTVMNRHYTDIAVVVGPNMRWVKDDVEDLEKFAPEALLGYQVHLATPGTFHQVTRGLWVMKFIILHGTFTGTGWYRYHNDMYMSLERYPWAKIEEWHVHRARGIWRIAEWRRSNGS